MRNAVAVKLSGRVLVKLAVAVKLIGYAVPHARYVSEWLWVPILVAGLISNAEVAPAASGEVGLSAFAVAPDVQAVVEWAGKRRPIAI